MRSKILYPLFACIVFFNSYTLAQQSPCAIKAGILFNGFKSADYNMIKPLLDSKVKIGDLPTGMNDAVMPQILAQMPKPDSCKITGEEQEGNGTRIRAVFIINGEEQKRSFLFNKDCVVTELDILGNAKATAMETPVSQSPETMPAKMTMPFRLKHGEIFVKAQLNGTEGEFLLDSGAPLLILNSAHLPKDAGKQTGTVAAGVGGTAGDIKMVHLDSLNWYGLEIKNSDALANDFGHLEKQLKHKFLGLIGYEVFKEYEITFDYDNKVITLVKTDDNGNCPGNMQQNGTPVCTTPFDQVMHIPVITLNISGNDYKMGIDCGAAGNLFYEKYIPTLKGNYNAKKNEKLAGAGKKITKVPTGIIKVSMIGKTEFKNMRTAFSDDELNELNNGYGLKIDGLLGYPFLKQYKTSINYKKKVMKFYN